MISYNYHREDHTSYWKKFKDIIKDYNEITVDTVAPKASRLRKIRELIHIIRLYREMQKGLEGIDGKPVRRVLACHLAEMKALEDRLRMLDVQSRAAFIFFDGNHIENLIVQYLRNRGVKVATMQHGQPVFHGMNVDRINQTMILNFSSDYIMVTGEFSKKQFMLGGVPEARIFVGGSLRHLKEIKTVDNHDFALFLDCPTNPNAIQSNAELIENAMTVSSLLGSSFVIKCHPQDDPKNYRDMTIHNGTFAPRGVGVGDVLKDVAFGLLHASGVYLDILSEGVKAFCYMNETDFPLVEDGMDSFRSVQELEEKIRAWNMYDMNKKRDYMRGIIDYYLSPDDVDKRYRDFAEKLNRA